MVGNIRIKGRPLRFAFLIEPNDKKALLKAIELNTVLWGGPFNPIIPLYQAKTKRWRKNAFRKTAKDINVGYIQAFDPDYLVCDFNPPDYIKNSGLAILKTDDILPSKENPDRFQYGIGLNEILSWLYNEYFRFVQRDPVNIVVPKIPARNKHFWSSWLGKLPDDFQEALMDSGYKQALEITTPKVKSLNKILKPKTLYPRRIMQHGLQTVGRGSFSHESILFYLDPSDFLDIVDYWNLRASGRSVLPAPITLTNDGYYREVVKDFIKSSQWTSRHNSALKHRANIIPSTSQTMDDARDFVTSLGLDKDEDGSNPILLHHWYPRIWDEWARGKDHTDPHDVHYDSEKEVDLSEFNDKVLLATSIPENIEFQFTGNPVIANEISYNIYGDLEKYAEVFPKTYGESVERTLGSIGTFRDWRIGRNGLVRLVDSMRSVSWDLPLAEEIFSSWLEDNGWQYQQSSSGKLAKELNKQIESWSYGLANKELIELIGSMAVSIDGEGRDKTVAYIKSKMRAIFGDEKRLEKFIELNLFSLGVNAKCPNCQRGSWYDLEDIDEKLSCPKCLQEFRAIDSLSESKWSYKTVGPLSVPNFAEGAISVVLAIEFFSERRMSSVQTTPVYSFNASKTGSGKKLEADFAFLWRESAYGEVADGVAFGEAKTFNEFKKKDFNRMRSLAKDFPGAVLVFSTLRDSLTPFEIIELKKLAKIGNKHWKLERPINPVLILTGKELFSFHRPPYCWSDQEQNKYRDSYGILGLARATQQKYLGMKRWDVVWHEELENKRKRSKKQRVKSKRSIAQKSL